MYMYVCAYMYVRPQNSFCYYNTSIDWPHPHIMLRGSNIRMMLQIPIIVVETYAYTHCAYIEGGRGEGEFYSVYPFTAF